MTDNNKPTQLLVLTSPGHVSPEGFKTVEEYLADTNGALILADGLTIQKGTHKLDGKTPFYLCAPGHVEKNLAKTFTDEAAKWLRRSGFTDFIVIFLPHGLSPMVIE